MRHRKNWCVLFKVTTISKKSRNRIQVAQLLFCVQCTKPTSPCAIHFSSDRNINSRGWSAQQRSPQLDFPMQLPLGTSDSALCTADSSRICGFPHNRMSQYYNAAFLQQKKSWKDILATCLKFPRSANTIIQLHCPCYCKTTINSQCSSTPKIQN